MSKYISIPILLIIFFEYSCKDKVPKAPDVLQDKLIISFDAIVEVNDEFQLYYKKKEEQYTNNKSRKVIIEGSNKVQKIVFVLDQLVFPQNLRLDLGHNKNQQIIKITNFELSYNNEKHLLSKMEFEKYFKANKYVKANFNELSFMPKPIGENYDPYLSSFDISYFVNKLILY